MGGGDKPYRVYRGGRVKGRVPLSRRPRDEERPARDGRFRPSEPKPPRVRRPRRWGRWIFSLVGLILLALIAWGVTSYLALRSGVQEANERLRAPVRAQLTQQDGLLLSKPSIFLLLGTDHAKRKERAGLRHSDSIMLVRTDPDRGRISYLSVPRDLRVLIPGHGFNKINAAFQFGGAALAVRTVRSYLQLPVHHAIIVDFADFEDVIDAIGGITVDVPRPILSNRFDCPYATTFRCQRWPGWRFAKGKQHMSGRRALVYARIRENRLHPDENDLSRGARQQQVLQAISGKLTSPLTLARVPFIGDDLTKPLATDLSAGQFVQLGWLKFRAGSDRALHCRLGGTASNVGGQSVIVPTEENFAVRAMFLGASAPQPPPPSSGPYGPGCQVGRTLR